MALKIETTPKKKSVDKFVWNEFTVEPPKNFAAILRKGKAVAQKLEPPPKP